jgi:hypothetical protein
MRTRVHFATAGSAVLLAVSLLAPGDSAAYETDQYTDRQVELEDSTEILNREMNAALAEVAARWNSGEKPGRFATAIYKEVGGRHWVDKLERWAIRSPEVDKIDPPKQESIYGHIPFWSTRVVFVVGLGPTLRVNETLIGSDKIGHFISQGWKYYKRHRRGLPEEKVLKLGPRNEAGIFGAVWTGVFSNADLVANYEGYLFFRSLFEDDIIPGKPAILRWEGNEAVIQRPFDWRDHVNDYWDEALNPNRFTGKLSRYVHENLIELCDDFERSPSIYRPGNDAELSARYAHIGMRHSADFRLDRVCQDTHQASAGQ